MKAIKTFVGEKETSIIIKVEKNRYVEFTKDYSIWISFKYICTLNNLEETKNLIIKQLEEQGFCDINFK